MAKTSFTLELPETDMNRLRIIAAVEDSSVARLVRQAVKEYLDRYIADEDARALRPLTKEEQQEKDRVWTEIFGVPPPKREEK